MMLRLSVSLTALVFASLGGQSLAFAPSSSPLPPSLKQYDRFSHRHEVKLSMANHNDNDNHKNGGFFRGDNLAKSSVAAAYILSNIFFTDVGAATAAMQDPSSSMNDVGGGSSQVIAARSGGRAGGRASGGMRRSAPRGSYRGGSSARYAAPATPVMPVTPYVAPSPLIITPGYSYNPLGGFGLGFGLGAMGSAGDSYRDFQQEREITRGQEQLRMTQERERELEARIRELERAQGGGAAAAPAQVAPQPVEATK